VHNQLYSGSGGGGGVQRSYSANAAYGYQQSQQVGAFRHPCLTHP
jgi:hypothetical protein